MDGFFLLVQRAALHNGIIAIIAELFKGYIAVHKRWAVLQG